MTQVHADALESALDEIGTDVNARAAARHHRLWLTLPNHRSERGHRCRNDSKKESDRDERAWWVSDV